MPLQHSFYTGKNANAVCFTVSILFWGSMLLVTAHWQFYFKLHLFVCEWVHTKGHMWRPVDTLWEFSFFPPQEPSIEFRSSGVVASILICSRPFWFFFFFLKQTIQLASNANDAPIETFSLFLTRCYIHSFELLLWLEIFPSTFFSHEIWVHWT